MFSLILDCSRIVSLHSGLGRFAQAVSLALHDIGLEFDLIAGFDDFPGASSVAPRHLRTRSSVSVLKPIVWMAYAHFGFPCKTDEPMLSVMQNVVPKSRNQVVTIHDLRPCFHPDNRLQQLYWRHVLPRSLRKAKAIVTVSETSRDKICATYGIPVDKIHVVSNCFVPEDEMFEHVEQRKNRLLCVGCNWKHKNVHEFLDMHELWRDRYHVDIVMAQTRYLETLQEKVARHDLEHLVTFHHSVSDQILRSMFRRSQALVYPSLDEGFGIPPLEAMSYGLPVIASDIPVLRELFLDAPLYVTLGDRGSWAQAFRNLDNPEAVRRHVEIGQVIARKFTPEAMRLQLANMIRAVWPDLIGSEK